MNTSAVRVWVAIYRPRSHCKRFVNTSTLLNESPNKTPQHCFAQIKHKNELSITEINASKPEYTNY